MEGKANHWFPTTAGEGGRAVISDFPGINISLGYVSFKGFFTISSFDVHENPTQKAKESFFSMC